MSEEVKAKVVEFVEIAKMCPDNLQEKCFEILLNSYMQSLRGQAPQIAPAEVSSQPDGQPEPGIAPEQCKETGSRLSNSNIHIKASRFLERYEVSLEQLNSVYYKQNDDFRPLYDDFKTTKTSESQLRVALLQSLQAALKTGEFEFNGEAVRSECIQRQRYDGSNFSSYFNKNKTLFDGFEKYDKKTPMMRLSETGRAKLADVVKKLG